MSRVEFNIFQQLPATMFRLHDNVALKPTLETKFLPESLKSKIQTCYKVAVNIVTKFPVTARKAQSEWPPKQFSLAI